MVEDQYQVVSIKNAERGHRTGTLERGWIFMEGHKELAKFLASEENEINLQMFILENWKST